MILKIYPNASHVRILVTTGVINTTFSASESRTSSSPVKPYTYNSGIDILTLALVLFGFWASSKIGHIPSTFGHLYCLQNRMVTMLLPLLLDLAAQMEQLNIIGPGAEITSLSQHPSSSKHHLVSSLPHLPIHLFIRKPFSSINISVSIKPNLSRNLYPYPLLVSTLIPHIYLPLVLKTRSHVAESWPRWVFFFNNFLPLSPYLTQECMRASRSSDTFLICYWTILSFDTDFPTRCARLIISYLLEAILTFGFDFKPLFPDIDIVPFYSI